MTDDYTCTPALNYITSIEKHLSLFTAFYKLKKSSSHPHPARPRLELMTSGTHSGSSERPNTLSSRQDKNRCSRRRAESRALTHTLRLFARQMEYSSTKIWENWNDTHCIDTCIYTISKSGFISVKFPISVYAS